MNAIIKGGIGLGLTGLAMYGINDRIESTNNRFEQQAQEIEACASMVGSSACVEVLYENVEPTIGLSDNGYLFTYSEKAITNAAEDKRDFKDGVVSRTLLLAAIGMVGMGATAIASNRRWQVAFRRAVGTW